MPNTRLRGGAALALFALTLGTLAAQPTADEQADALLNAARKAYADANPQFAAEKFGEFLTKFGAHKDASAARFRDFGLTASSNAVTRRRSSVIPGPAWPPP